MPLWSEEDLGVESLTPDVRDGLYHLALIGDDAAGTVKLQWSDPSVWPDAGSDEALYLHRLAVRRRFAGGGVSGALLTYAAEVANRAGRRYLRLDCDASRARLRAFYLSAGFHHHSDTVLGSFRVARFERTVP
jgi:GNAT superfamily N-acetyltransferase